jgi:hypothetical protein
LNKLRSNNLEIFKLEQFTDKNTKHFFIIQKKTDQLLSPPYHILISKRLKQVRSEHSGSTLRQTAKIFNEAISFVLCFPVDEYLKLENGLWLYDQQIL